MNGYRHTQVGWVIIGSTLALTAVFVLTNRSLLEGGSGLFVLLLFPALLLLFGSLTVTIDGGELSASFGIGLIRKTIPLSEVLSVGVVKNRWLIGWGIRFFPGGTLYNVSGLHAVELRMVNGRIYRIGTDQPHALEAALRARIRENKPLAQTETVPRGKVGKALRWIAVGALVLGLIGLIVFGVCLAILEPRPPSAVITPDGLTVASFAYSTTVRVGEITAVSLEQRLPRILRRTNGFSAAGVLRGHFDVEGLGKGMLFVDVSSPPFVLVRTTSSFVMVGFDGPQQALELERELRAAWDHAR